LLSDLRIGGKDAESYELLRRKIRQGDEISLEEGDLLDSFGGNGGESMANLTLEVRRSGRKTKR
jgi:hypothetical protein